MEFTGERVIPGQDDVDLFNEHRARYWFARRFAKGKNVLDAACGTGYGSALLAETAQAVVGVDVARNAVDYARRHFPAPNFQLAQTDCLALPFSADRFGLVVAFEIIEHLDQPETFLTELRRVLDPAGALILSTPNRLYYTDEREEINPFHRREFSYPEFEEILRPVFPHCTILFQNHVAGVAVSGPGSELSSQALHWERLFQEEGATQAIEEARRSAHFFVAVCSSQPLGPIEPLLYMPSAANILREREIHIHSLDATCRELEHRLAEKDAYVLQLQEEHDSKIQWAQSLERDLDKARSDLAQLQKEYERDLDKVRGDLAQLQAEYDSKIQWAQSLERDLDKVRGDLAQLQAEYDSKIQWAQSLECDLDKARSDLAQLQEEYDSKIQWAQSLECDLDKARSDLAQLQEEYDSKIQWAQSLECDLDKARSDLAQLQEEYDSKIQWAQSLECDLDKARSDLAQLQKEFEERTAWALRLDRDLQQRSKELQLRSEELQLLFSSRWYRLGKNLNLSPVPASDMSSSDSNQT